HVGRGLDRRMAGADATLPRRAREEGDGDGDLVRRLAEAAQQRAEPPDLLEPAGGGRHGTRCSDQVRKEDGNLDLRTLNCELQTSCRSFAFRGGRLISPGLLQVLSVTIVSCNTRYMPDRRQILLDRS